MIPTIVIVVLFAISAFCLLTDKIPKFNIKKQFLSAASDIEKNISSNKKTTHKAKDYVITLNGAKKENFAQRAIREARMTYKKTGRSRAYQSLTARALFCAIVGLIIGIVFRSVALSIILPVGCYFLPMWFAKFSLYRFEAFLNDELEISLSVVTTSYQRSGNFIGAVQENLIHFSEPIKSAFIRFVNNFNYIDSNIETQLALLKNSIDNPIWEQWCDAVLLCQSNHNQMVNLTPIVHKFSALKAQQQANKNRMMIPLRRAVIMVALPICYIVVIALIKQDWFELLVNTVLGQISLAVTAISALITINKAINLSKPITYNV